MQPANQKAFHGGASFDAIGSDFADLSRRHGIVDADVLDAWYEPAPAVLATLREHLPWLVKTSPPTHGDGLRAAIAQRHGLSPQHVLIGGGTSALMFLAFPRLVARGDRVAILDPMYGEYRHIFANVIGADVVACELDEARGFRPDPAAIAAQVEAMGARLLVMVNPNSPTGVGRDAEGLRRLLALLPADVRVWIDETYIDFVPDVPTAEALVGTDRRLVVAKSMSKFFALTDHTGQERTLADFKGKVVTIFFGYTQCPDVCPTALSDMSMVMQQLGADGDKVQVLFVTVDPERDTPALLAEYVPVFDERFLGLYGEPEKIAAVAKDFRVFYRKSGDLAGHYTIDHSAGTYVFDPQGRLRLYMKHGEEPAKVAADIGALLAGK